MKDYIEKELDDIIMYEKIYAVFQPIIPLRDGQILGYEALSRLKENISKNRRTCTVKTKMKTTKGKYLLWRELVYIRKI